MVEKLIARVNENTIVDNQGALNVLLDFLSELKMIK